MTATTQKIITTSKITTISQLKVGDKFRFSGSGIQHDVRDKSSYFIEYGRIGEFKFEQWWFVSEDREVVVNLEV